MHFEAASAITLSVLVGENLRFYALAGCYSATLAPLRAKMALQQKPLSSCIVLSNDRYFTAPQTHRKKR